MSEKATSRTAVESVVHLSYDEKTGCWIDSDGQAWTVSATADIVDLVRGLPDDRSKCPLCRRRFGTKKQPDFHARKLHLLNDHSSWSPKIR